MPHQKCNDCPTKISIAKVISLILFVIGVTFGLAKIYFRFEVVEKNQIELTTNVKVIADHLKKNGDIPANTCFLLPDSTNYIPADNVICQKDDEDDKRQRITNKETAIDQKHYQEVE